MKVGTHKSVGSTFILPGALNNRRSPLSIFPWSILSKWLPIKRPIITTPYAPAKAEQTKPPACSASSLRQFLQNCNDSGFKHNLIISDTVGFFIPFIPASVFKDVQRVLTGGNVRATSLSSSGASGSSEKLMTFIFRISAIMSRISALPLLQACPQGCRAQPHLLHSLLQ